MDEIAKMAARLERRGIPSYYDGYELRAGDYILGINKPDHEGFPDEWAIFHEDDEDRPLFLASDPLALESILIELAKG